MQIERCSKKFARVQGDQMVGVKSGFIKLPKNYQRSFHNKNKRFWPL